MFFKVLFAGTIFAVLTFSGWANADCGTCPSDDPLCEKVRAQCEAKAAAEKAAAAAKAAAEKAAAEREVGSRATKSAPPKSGGPPQQGSRVTSPAQSAPESAPIAVEAAPNAPATVLPSRAFLPPHDIPPEDFAAYGIVAFSQEATSSTTRRHILVCEAFVATLPAASLTQVPPKQQMVTVWPVDSEPIPAALAGSKPDCKVAVERYHLPTALTALKQARTQKGHAFAGEGPY